MKVENNLMSRCILRGKMSVGGLLLLTGMGLSSCNFLDFDQSIGFDSQEEVYEVFSRAEQSLTKVVRRTMRIMYGLMEKYIPSRTDVGAPRIQ